ncbi:MAG: hypothetical protein ACK4KV_21705 [Rhodocyclaceae bacterium]
MRTLILVVVGLLLAAGVLRFAPSAWRTAAVGGFTLVWLVACGFNLRTGLSHGYTMAQELPIHAVLFGIPVVAAWAAWWWLRR